jgi:hypothetical protein
MFDAVDVHRYAPHRRRQLRRRRLGRLSCWRWLGWLGRLRWLRGGRRRNGNSWATWPSLNGGRYRWLGLATGDGNARPGNHAHGDCTCTCADQEVTSRGQRTNLLATG